MLREQFDRLPREAQDEVLDAIGYALEWRGWDRLPRGGVLGSHWHAGEAVKRIEEVFRRHGMEFAELT